MSNLDSSIFGFIMKQTWVLCEECEWLVQFEINQHLQELTHPKALQIKDWGNMYLDLPTPAFPTLSEFNNGHLPTSALSPPSFY